MDENGLNAGYHTATTNKSSARSQEIIMLTELAKKVTRSVSNASSAMRGKREPSTRAVVSEVAVTERSCYGVFRQLEPDDGGDRPVDFIAGRSPQPPSPPVSADRLSPREHAFAYGTDCCVNDCDDDDRDTFSAYCDTVVTNNSVAASAAGGTTTGGCEDDDGLSDLDTVVWDEYDYTATTRTPSVAANLATDTAVNTADPRAGGAAAAPYSHTPMGSTTKLVGIDTSSDDTPKIYCCKSKCLQGFGTLLMTISLSISLANIIRLPRMVYLYGGGTFLVSYLAVALVFGVPLIFLEITLGQFCQQGTTKLWRAVPLLKGVGFVKVLASMLLAAYYPIIMALSVFYGTRSIIGSIPFPECGNAINFYGSIVNKGEECLQQTFLMPPHMNWQWIVMDVSFILIVWIVVAISLIKNSKSYRTAALLVVPVTFVALAILLARGLNADRRGLEILLEIRWDHLLTLDIWYHAVVQFLFTTHLGFGNITTCAGRLYSKSNPFWTSVLLTLSSVIVGVCSVSIVTMWIYDMQKAGAVMSPTAALSEVWFLTFVYEMAAKGVISNLWATLVYVLVFLSGFLSLIAATYTAVVGLSVETKEKWKWWILTCTVCFIGFLVGVLCLLPENLQAVHLLDEYVVARMVVTSTVLELIGFVWIYGLESLSNDFEFVLGYKLCFLWKTIWIGTPVLFTVLEIWSLFVMPLSLSEHSSHDSMWLYVIGWLIYLFTWSLILGLAVWQISAQVDYNVSQKFLSTVKPSRNWGPVDTIYRHCWVQWKKQYQVTGERDFTLRRRGTRDYTHSIKRGKHAAPPGTAYSISPSSLGRTSSGYSTGNSPVSRNDSHLDRTHDHLRWSRDMKAINYM
ncbi:sodium-dependent nutrient amino acid transporter 1-like isoform X2 [Adelges cooleyi]|uniref:sodium-dependent nutrient amino acid transporter 1-like isoform X2 n=1 Tax=Adelges cooleyi TaxID=133065 RepID=UPI00217F3A24|nr:sodium-dependent nutrient amino acid transporter 1-like isoform X2 [Adelges cooleyi]